MALHAHQLLAPAGGQRTQGDPLIQLHMIADHGGLADDHTGAVVDEEVFTDLCTGIDVDAGAAVGVFGHDAGDVGHVLQIQLVGHPVDVDGVEARVAEDDFLPAFGGGVALKAGLHILQKGLLQSGQLFKKRGAHLVGPGLGVQLAAVLAALIQKSSGQQRAQVVVQTVQPVAGVVVAKIAQAAAGAVIAGEDDLLQIPQDVDHRLAVGQLHALLEGEQLVTLVIFVQALHRFLDGPMFDLVHKRLLSPENRPFAASGGRTEGE